MDMLRRSALQILFFTVFKIAGALNQCSDTVYKELGDLAKRSPTYMYDAVPLCDRYLAQGWYRAGFHQIPTTAPWLTACGTLFPYWMDDTAPNNEGETKSVKVCQVGFSGPCERTHNIRMTNCGRFFVYELIPLDICSAAYCFGVSDIPTNIEVKYHSVSWATTQEGVTTHYDPDVNLACHFDRLSDDALFYDVTWYVDDTEVLTNQSVSSNSSDVALLSGSQMVAKGKKANSMIHCVVGAVFRVEDRPCNTNSSGLFFAGIKMITPKLRIPRGGSAEAQFQFTIPFISRHSITKVPLRPPLQGERIFEHQMALFVSMYITGGPVDCNDLDRKACDVQVKAYNRIESEKYDTDDWKVIHTKKVYNRDDGDFDILDKHITLRFATGVTNGVGSKIFDSLTLQDIQVFIEETDSSWKGTYCESHTDPHMKTFDGKYYECQLDGTFVLYRNDVFEQEVQEKHHLCYPRYSYPRCSCAVAVRSGKDIFTVDICNSRTIINFPLCEDKTLNVIKKNDRYYKIIFPTGTMVEIKFISWPTHNDWQLNVDIFPSPSDVGNSSGLCGVLDGNYRNDFTRNDAAQTNDNPDHYHYHNPPNAFSESWRVKNNELNLFDESTYGNLESISNVYERVCSCKKIEGKPADIECNYGTYKNCKFVVGKKFHCMLNPEGQLRRKRDLRHIESLLSNSYGRNTSKWEERRPKREAITILKTYEEAEDICLNAFQNSQPYQTCKEYISDLSNTSLENCISDVMMTGDDNFTKIHIEAALEQCSVFVVLNTTFQQTEPEITNKIETLCQNNCSGHGLYNDGNCTCEPDFAGSDCSFDLLGPPSITHISDFGLCDKSKETCEEITVFGKYFIENMNTNCYMKRKTYQVDGITVSMVDYETDLQERTLFEGFCPLEYSSDDHWVTEFTFNISNDGTRFTDIYFVYTYQSLCQEYQNNTGTITFLFKDGFCYINNKCIPDGSTDENNKCNICNTNQMKYEWSFNPDHCFIDGICYKSDDINGTNPCDVCMPTTSTTTWSPDPDLCFIDGICYLPDQTKLGSECYACEPNASRDSWTFKDGYCLINKECVVDGESNAMHPCQICDTTQSYYSWTLKLDHCFIDGMCYKSGDENETNPCDVCMPTTSTTTWSSALDMCFIDGVCYLPEQTKTGSECFACESNTSRNSWTFKDGYCLINKECYIDGESNEMHPCQICDVAQCNSSWKLNPGHCLINEVCYKSGDINGTNNCSVCIPEISSATWSLATGMCFIDNTCYPDGQQNPDADCSICKSDLSRTAWTLHDGCFSTSLSTAANERLTSTDTSLSSRLTSIDTATSANPVVTTYQSTTHLQLTSQSIQELPTTDAVETLSKSESPTTVELTTKIPKLTTTITKPITSGVTVQSAVSDTPSTESVTIKETTTEVSTIGTEKTITPFTSESKYEQTTSTKVATTKSDKTTKSESPTTVELTTEIPKLTTTITKPITAEVPVQSTVSDIPSTEPVTIKETTTEVSTIGTPNPMMPFTSESINEHTTSTKVPTTKSDKTTEMSTEESSVNSGKPVSEQSSTTMFITTEQKLPVIETTEIYIESTPELITSTKTGPLTNTITVPMDGTFKSTTDNHQQTPIADKTTSYTTSKSTQSLCWESPEDVTVVYHNVSWISTIEAANRTVHEPSVNLRCNFSLFRDVSLHYNVEWYVDEDTLVKESQVNTATIERSILSMQDLFPWSITAGTKIRCRVGVMIHAKQKPCTFSTSPGFIAGIKILNTTQTILRKGTAKIAFHLTTPYVSSIIETNGQFEHPTPLEVHSVLLPDSTRCEDTLGFDKCVIYISAFPYTESPRFESDLWRKTHVITVYHMDTNKYKLDSSETFGLKTIREGDTFWNDVFYHNVTIKINDQNDIWKGKFCGSKTDPHIYTFDGVSYENHISGDFILYRNSLFNQEIQTTHRLCYPSYNFPYCTCAVSIQSGQDVFLIDVCHEKSFIDYISCNDSVMQVNKLRDKLYKIVFPTGTFVLVSLVPWPIKDAWQIDIDLFPSLSDVNNTYGLCGTLDGIKDNEFTRRDGYKDNVTLLYPNEFSRSWKVQDGENLLREPIINRQPISSTLDHICICTPNGKQCLYKTFKSCLIGPEIQCTVLRNQNRPSSIQKQQNISESGESQLLRKKRQTVPYIKTKEEAQDICFAAFQVSETYRMCREHVGDLSNSSYVNCIIDLMMTGDVNITTPHVESAIQQCATFITLNDTLQTTNPDATIRLKSFCPRNCSNHGYCVEGNCTCDQGYGGSDCSFDTLSVPEIWSTVYSNICDKSTQSCSSMHFTGRYFIENIKKTCYIQRTLVRHDGSAINMAHFEQPLIAHNLFRGSCLLPFVRDTAWVTQYTLNVSYGGKEFTKAINLYVYQSECQQHISDDGRDKFFLKEGFCFINNACVTQGSSNSNDSCYMCDPTKHKYTWTQNTDCVISSSPTPEEFTISSMIYILIACIAVIILVVPVAIWKYRKSHGYKQFYRIDDHQKEINEELSLKFNEKSKKPEDYVPMTHIDGAY